MTQIDPAKTAAPPLEAPPQTPARTRDRLFYALIAVILIAAVAILGYAALRPVQTPGTPGPLPSVDTRAADEAAALDALQKVDVAYAVAARNLTVDGSGLEGLVSSSVLEHERQFYQSLKDQGVVIRGETVPTQRIRGYTVNPGDTRVTFATCTDVRNWKFVVGGVETPTMGPDGKPADFTFGRAELTKQMNGSWLLT
ncbi:MAG: hypothetical protein WCG47_33055, partial [Dermatophilaceae bacterium]